MGTTPMFPLGSVLLPGAVLPLHVFEDRYRALVRTCLAGDREFGVVLIARGSEVGGDDVRTDVGTIAGIAEAQELPDGRWALIGVGLHRVRVVAWGPDEPFPQAEVAPWPDPEPGPRHPVLLAEATTRMRRVLALAAEAGESTAPATVELVEDPVLAGYQICALTPVGPLDRQGLLAATTPEERLELVLDHLAGAEELLELLLAEGGR